MILDEFSLENIKIFELEELFDNIVLQKSNTNYKKEEKELNRPG